MGSGFLALPKAFASAGLVLATVVLILTMLTLRTTVMYEVEVMCRAEGWVKANLVPYVLKTPRTTRRDSEKEMHISTHAFQVTEMCELFGGRKLQLAYCISLMSYMFFTLWGFGAVFGDALATYAPVPFLGSMGAYRMYVVLFSVVVVPLSMLEIKEQAVFQIVLTGLRFVIMVLMVGSVLMSLHTGGEPFGHGMGEFIGTTPAVRWWGIFRLVPSVIFSLTMASAPPTIVAALERKNTVGILSPKSWFGDRKRVKNAYKGLEVQIRLANNPSPHKIWPEARNIWAVIWTTMISAAAMYGLISLATAYYFGTSVDGSCNVNWEFYRPGVSGSAFAMSGRLLAYVVVLFPAIDVTSVYPLNVMVLANNMMAAVYHDHVDNAETDLVIIRTFRVLCSVPPLMCALLLRDFAAIVSYGGCLTILIVLVFPAYLNLISKRMCDERFGSSKTPFTSTASSTPVLIGIIAFGLLLFVGLLVEDIVAIIS